MCGGLRQAVIGTARMSMLGHVKLRHVMAGVAVQGEAVQGEFFTAWRGSAGKAVQGESGLNWVS